MKRFIIILTFFYTLTFYLSALAPVNAQLGTGSTDFKFEQPKGFGIQALNPGNANQAEGIIQTIMVNVISIFFTVGGLGVVIYFVWGAVEWILSGGDKEKVGNARKKMTNAIIGLVLLSLSYVIITIVGEVVGFNPLGNLQLRNLGAIWEPAPNP